MIHQHGFTQQGWECPKCGRVYSPTTIMCLSCPQTVKTNTTTNTPWSTITVPNDDNVFYPSGSNINLCFEFTPDESTSSATKCKKCGMEKFQHPTITNL
jgi:uncharacterized OB-fold protein